ncbi:hypothetical protein ABH924_004808 [Arthrobacter sp. GAS37]|uniref:hypothetical protein n=1 Tax=Arthrobacter sp. GAS37 TaxID=3156261 RepID=UPI0038323ACB
MKIQTAPVMPIANGAWRLLARWRDQSLLEGWRFAGDWFVPEVEGVAGSIMNESPVEHAARRLGASRSYNGVGIGETMTDLKALFTAAGRPVDYTAFEEIAVGWVEATERDHLPSSCTDVTTGLATPAHFERILHDAGLATDRAGDLVLGTLRFPVMDKRLRGDWSLAADVGQICTQEFNESIPQVYRRDTIHFLMKVTTENFTEAVRCRERLEALRNGVLGGGELTYRPVPSSEAEALSLVAELRGSPPRRSQP